MVLGPITVFITNVSIAETNSVKLSLISHNLVVELRIND
jgi:hypothetical protein